MGGYLALCYAAKHPERLNSVITMGTKFNWTEEQALQESKMLDPETIAEKFPNTQDFWKHSTEKNGNSYCIPSPI